MRIESVRIENLRSFEDATITFDDYTCLVGPNGAGKSTVLCALNIFFRESGNAPFGQSFIALSGEDFHGKDTSRPIRITVTFVDLNAEAQEDFKHYFRNGKLVLAAEATFVSEGGRAEVLQHGWRRGIPQFASVFKIEDGPASDVRKQYELLQKEFPLPAWKSKPAAIEALRAHETEHDELCELLESRTQAYGFTGGANLLAKHVQWVFVPAVKDASGEQLEVKNSALTKLLARAVGEKAKLKEPVAALRLKTQQEYLALLANHDGALADLSAALQKRLVEWAHPGATLRLAWNRDDDGVKVPDPLAGVLAGETGFEGSLGRLGHGLQRCYIMALLQEVAENGLDTGPRLILACEEPELYQHPPQARHLGDVFKKLGKQNAQVIICTHSPHFVSGETFESVRLVRKRAGSLPRSARKSFVSMATTGDVADRIATATGKPAPKAAQGTLAKIHQELTTAKNEMFFTPVLFLVEGREDIAYATSYLTLLGLWDEWRRLGGHLVAVDGKSNMRQPLAVAMALGIPTYIVFDADGHVTGNARTEHERDNAALLKLAAVVSPPFPTGTLWAPSLTVWESELSEVVEAELASPEWTKVKEEVTARYGHPGNLKKNSLFIGETMALAWERGMKSKSLMELCRSMLGFAQSAESA